MNHELAQATLQFLQRVQLTGQEVQAFNAVTAALSRMAQPPREQSSLEQEAPVVTAEEPEGAA